MYGQRQLAHQPANFQTSIEAPYLGGISVMGETNPKFSPKTSTRNDIKPFYMSVLYMKLMPYMEINRYCKRKQSYPHWKGGKGMETRICPQPDRLAVQ